MDYSRSEAPARPATPAREPAPQAEQSGGWVQDLLRRASADEAPAPRRPVADTRSPRQVVDSLNSISVDIARAIDHEAAMDLWKRYSNGERNVFTRRLYTLKGQQTFDEIRSKYQSSGEFRTVVDRYCDDFERLLADVTRNERDPSVAQSYLASEQGKVYTMLAHASGRLR